MVKAPRTLKLVHSFDQLAQAPILAASSGICAAAFGDRPLPSRAGESRVALYSGVIGEGEENELYDWNENGVELRDPTPAFEPRGKDTVGQKFNCPCITAGSLARRDEGLAVK
jgi:hypothetical protein